MFFFISSSNVEKIQWSMRNDFLLHHVNNSYQNWIPAYHLLIQLSTEHSFESMIVWTSADATREQSLFWKIIDATLYEVWFYASNEVIDEFLSSDKARRWIFNWIPLLLSPPLIRGGKLWCSMWSRDVCCSRRRHPRCYPCTIIYDWSVHAMTFSFIKRMLLKRLGKEQKSMGPVL